MPCWLSTASATFKFIADKDGMMTDHKAFQLANVRVPSPRRHRKRPGSARRAEVTSPRRNAPSEADPRHLRALRNPKCGLSCRSLQCTVLAPTNWRTVCANHHRGVLILVVATASDD